MVEEVKAGKKTNNTVFDLNGKLIKGYCDPIDPEEQKVWEAAEIKIGTGVTDFLGAEDQAKPLGDGKYPLIAEDRK